MEQIGTRDPRADFMAVYGNTIKRDGAASMLYWLDSKTDFFAAPASSKHHLAQPGGLAIHMRHHFVGVEINPDYWKMATDRIAETMQEFQQLEIAERATE